MICLALMDAVTGTISTFAADTTLGPGGTLAPPVRDDKKPAQPLAVTGTADQNSEQNGSTTLGGGATVSGPGQVQAGKGGWAASAHENPTQTQPQNPPVKAPLAPAAVPPKLVTDIFDAMAKALKLSAEQVMQVGALKQRIKDEGERLAREHERARTAYANSQTKEAFDAAKKDVDTTDKASVDFDPNTRFSRGLILILTGEQYGLYWDEVTKNVRIAPKK